MEQSLSWEADSSSANQEIPRNLRNPKVHYRVHKNPPFIPVPKRFNPVQASTHISSRFVLILSFHLRLGLPSDSFKFLHHKYVEFLFCPIRVTFLTHVPSKLNMQ
jgi:hypothetical protein